MEPGPGPPRAVLELASLGDRIPVAYLLAIHLQSIADGPYDPVPFRRLDYERLRGWLSAILDLHPAGAYPLMMAARLYAEVPDEPRQRLILDWIYEVFLEAPSRRWQWLAHATAIAKHRLKDLPLARKYAAAIQRHAVDENVPMWARQMEAFILEDMNELEAARIMIGGFIEQGMVQHPGELRFLERRLQELEARIQAEK